MVARMRTTLSILVLTLTVGCGISKEVYQADVNRLSGQIQELETSNSSLLKESGLKSEQLAKLRATLTHAQRELAGLRSQGAHLDASLASALSRVRELEEVAARQKAIFDKLHKALESLVKSGKLTVAIVKGQFTVQMSDKILFDSGKYALKEEAAATLTELTNILRSIPDRRYEVVGHTDTDGSDDFNWKLSGNRSRSVMSFMIAQGMPPERLLFAGAGPFQPTAANDTPENKAMNRRIEIVLIPNLEELLAPLSDKK